MGTNVMQGSATGTAITSANLSVAAVAAAGTAAALGKVQRKHELAPREVVLLRDVADTLKSYSDVFGGSSYFAVVARNRPMDTLAEIAVQSGQAVTEEEAALNFEKHALELRQVAAGERLAEEEMSLLHEYFRALALTINRKLTSPGERPNSEPFQ